MVIFSCWVWQNLWLGDDEPIIAQMFASVHILVVGIEGLQSQTETGFLGPGEVACFARQTTARHGDRRRASKKPGFSRASRDNASLDRSLGMLLGGSSGEQRALLLSYVLSCDQ